MGARCYTWKHTVDMKIWLSLTYLTIKEENCALMISTILQKKMNISEPIQLSRVYRLGAYSNDSTRPIIVHLYYALDKMRVWRARTMLMFYPPKSAIWHDF